MENPPGSLSLWLLSFSSSFFKFVYFLAAPHGMWDLSSPTRGHTHAPCTGSSLNCWTNKASLLEVAIAVISHCWVPLAPRSPPPPLPYLLVSGALWDTYMWLGVHEFFLLLASLPNAVACGLFFSFPSLLSLASVEEGRLRTKNMPYSSWKHVSSYFSVCCNPQKASRCLLVSWLQEFLSSEQLTGFGGGAFCNLGSENSHLHKDHCLLVSASLTSWVEIIYALKEWGWLHGRTIQQILQVGFGSWRYWFFTPRRVWILRPKAHPPQFYECKGHGGRHRPKVTEPISGGTEAVSGDLGLNSLLHFLAGWPAPDPWIPRCIASISAQPLAYQGGRSAQALRSHS